MPRNYKSDYLKDRKTTLKFLDFAINKLLEEETDIESHHIDLFKDVLKSHGKNCIETIYKYAESPIELIFLNSD